MSKSTTTYIRKADGARVEVIMEPVGWEGWKKVLLPTGGLADNVVRITNAQFEQEYELPKASLFARFFKGIR